MSNTRYLEIASTFRDRTLWPNPGEFDVLISQSGRKGISDAVDPVSSANPVFAWSGNRFQSLVDGATVTATVTALSGVGFASDNSTFVIQTASASGFQRLENYYIAAVARDTTNATPSKRRIISSKYLKTTGGQDYMLITVFSPFSDSLIVVGDTILISDPTDFSDTTNPIIFVPAGDIGTDSYVNHYLYNETLNQYRVITGYDSGTHILKLNTTTGAVAGWAVTDEFSIRKEIPSFISTTTAASTNRNVIISAGSSINNDYSGMFIRVRAVVYGSASVAPENEARRISTYDGATKTATVFPPFSAAVPAAATLEILSFTYDNLNPFTYSGSLVSQQEMVCYEIELINLILPNLVLASGFGSRISFYPYVYVELTTISGSSSGGKNIIYSNNPNSTRMTFRATIDDVPNPVISSFIKIDGDGMLQTIKFKPNDSLHFAVRFPNGDLFQTVIVENVSPAAPDTRNQISALFSLKRL